METRILEPKSWKEASDGLLKELKYMTGATDENADAGAVFAAIQQLYDGQEGLISCDSSLLHNLATCARVALNYPPATAIPWEEHDHILERCMSALMHTLIFMLNSNDYSMRHTGTYCGNLYIPRWFFSWARKQPTTLLSRGAAL